MGVIESSATVVEEASEEPQSPYVTPRISVGDQTLTKAIEVAQGAASRIAEQTGDYSHLYAMVTINVAGVPIMVSISAGGSANMTIEE